AQGGFPDTFVAINGADSDVVRPGDDPGTAIALLADPLAGSLRLLGWWGASGWASSRQIHSVAWFIDSMARCPAFIQTLAHSNARRPDEHCALAGAQKSDRFL